MHDDSQIAALALTLAERWPLINSLPEAQRAAVKESIRRLRLETLSPRVTSADSPGKATPDRTTVPGPWADPSGEAGILHRGEFRGVRADSGVSHRKPCLWSGALWPMTPAGDVLPCSCGLGERLEGPIAARVSGHLWNHFDRIEHEDHERARKQWARLSAKQRREAIRIARKRGVSIPTWML